MEITHSKKVFFVRHGETQSNIDKTVQSPEELLTEKGREQAEKVALKLKDSGIETIISSSMDRALETAQYIENEVQAGIVISDYFTEVLQPQEYYGRSMYDEEIKENRALRWNHYDDPYWRYSNEENFHDLKVRAQKALELIESREETTLCVVTHGHFLRFFIAYMIFREDLSPAHWKRLEYFMKIKNTGIAEFVKIVPLNNVEQWVMVEWGR